MASNRANQPNKQSKQQPSKTPLKSENSLHSLGSDQNAHTQEEQVLELGSQEAGTLLLGMKASRVSGPLPHPDFAEKYEALCPGALDRLLTMVEKQSDHRRSMESLSVQAQIKDMADDRLERRRGQIFGLIIALAFIFVGGGASIFASNTAGQIVGAVFGGTGVIGLVSLFVIGRDKPPAMPSPEQKPKPASD